MQTLATIGRALRRLLAPVDPKLLSTIGTAIAAWLVVEVGLDLTSPTGAAAVAVIAAAIAGAIVPNAGSGLIDRWTPAPEQGIAPAVPEPAEGVPDLDV